MSVIPFELLTLENIGVQPLMNCIINEHEASMIIDTGASKSVISETFVKKITGESKGDEPFLNMRGAGIGDNHEETYITVVPEIICKNKCANNFEFVVIDISHINEILTYLEEEEVHGLIGSDLLSFWQTEIDYGNLRKSELLIYGSDGCQIIFPVKVAGKDLRFIVDTGASKSVLGLDAYNNLPVKPDKKKNELPVAGISSSDPLAKLFQPNSFSIGGFISKPMDFISMNLDNINSYYEMINRPPIDGLIGGDFLLKHSAIIDFKNNEIKLQQII